MTRKVLLVCGILSSLLYVAMNVVVVMSYPGYDWVSQTVSELSAIGTPTRALWVGLAMAYTVLVIAFGSGVVWSSAGNQPLRVVGILMLAASVIGIWWPPMHQREVLGAGGGTLTDKLHIAWAMFTSLCFLVTIGFGAAAFGKRFRAYSIMTIVILLTSGMMTALDGPKIDKNLPTPWVGVWERINIGVYMLWVAVLAVRLLRATSRSEERARLVGAPVGAH